jgi:hypothetical protein
MKFILSIVFCFFFLFIHSQNYLDLVNLSYTNTPNNTFENSDSKTTIEEFALELNFPIKLNDKTVLLTSFYGNKTNLQLDFNTLNESLNVMGLGLGINKTFNEKWSGTFIVFPKLAADKLSFSGDNMQLGFLALITKKRREDLKYKFGVYANTENYGLLVVPIFGLYYLSPNKKFEANLNLPIIADANYKIGDRTWIGMKFDGLGTTYNLTHQNYTNNGAYVSKVSNELVSYFRFQMSKSIYLNTKIGYAISRNYEVYEINDKIDWALASIYFGDNRTQLNNRFKDGAIFKIELLYRLHF